MNKVLRFHNHMHYREILVIQGRYLEGAREFLIASELDAFIGEVIL